MSVAKAITGVLTAYVLLIGNADAQSIFYDARPASSGNLTPSDVRVLNLLQPLTLGGPDGTYRITQFYVGIQWDTTDTYPGQDVIVYFYTGLNLDPNATNALAGSTLVGGYRQTLSAPAAPGAYQYTFTPPTPITVPSNQLGVRIFFEPAVIGEVTNLYIRALFRLGGPPTVGSNPGFIYVDKDNGIYSGSEQTKLGDSSSANYYLGVRAVAVTPTPTPGCIVGPLTALTDPETLSFEAGKRIDVEKLNSSMKASLASFQSRVEDAGGKFVLDSAWRPEQYQAHLREVWTKWQQLRVNTKPECQELRAEVESEMAEHKLFGLRTSPAAPPGPHTRGAAIDVSVDPNTTGLPLTTFLSHACAANLYRRLPVKDKWHFENGKCASPPQIFANVREEPATLASEPSNASGSDLLKVEVSDAPPETGTEQYRYSVSNNTGQNLVAFFIGYDGETSELLTAPLGWDVDAGVPDDSMDGPQGWDSDVITTEEVEQLMLRWAADSSEFGLPSGTNTHSFSVSLDSKANEYVNAHWTAILADGQLLSGTVVPKPPRLANISTRLKIGDADEVLIGGFIVTGVDPKRVIIRGIGPSLAQFFEDGLADPSIELFQGNTLLESNDNWIDRRAEIEATGIPPTNDLEAAIVRTLAPGAYTTILRGVNNGTGVGLVEVYDLDRTVDSKLANISTRGFVQTGDNVMIGGFIVVGQTSTKVIVRAIGPSLSVPGKLADPTLELRDANGALLRSNDNWRTGGQEAEIIATTIPPSNDLESAVVRALVPGNYTAIMRGVGNGTGIGLIEAYDLGPP